MQWLLAVHEQVRAGNGMAGQLFPLPWGVAGLQDFAQNDSDFPALGGAGDAGDGDKGKVGRCWMAESYNEWLVVACTVPLAVD